LPPGCGELTAIGTCVFMADKLGLTDTDVN
jgi:hypothetical protein